MPRYKRKGDMVQTKYKQKKRLQKLNALRESTLRNSRDTELLTLAVEAPEKRTKEEPDIETPVNGEYDTELLTLEVDHETPEKRIKEEHNIETPVNGEYDTEFLTLEVDHETPEERIKEEPDIETSMNGEYYTELPTREVDHETPEKRIKEEPVDIETPGILDAPMFETPIMATWHSVTPVKPPSQNCEELSSGTQISWDTPIFKTPANSLPCKIETPQSVDSHTSESNEANECENVSDYTVLKEMFSSRVHAFAPFVLDSCHEGTGIHLMQLYRSGLSVAIKTSVFINDKFNATISVHRKEISKEHEIWEGLPAKFDSLSSISELVKRLNTYSVCVGNPDKEWQDMVPDGSRFINSDSTEILAYREGDFCASQGNSNLIYHCTIRSTRCCMLVRGARCSHCSSYRRLLRKKKQRREERHKKEQLSQTNYLHSTYKHSDMTLDMLKVKLCQQKKKIQSLENALRITQSINCKGQSPPKSW